MLNPLLCVRAHDLVFTYGYDFKVTRNADDSTLKFCYKCELIEKASQGTSDGLYQTVFVLKCCILFWWSINLCSIRAYIVDRFRFHPDEVRLN